MGKRVSVYSYWVACLGLLFVGLDFEVWRKRPFSSTLAIDILKRTETLNNAEAAEAFGHEVYERAIKKNW